MPQIEHYHCTGCEYDMEDDYYASCDCCSEVWCEDCYYDHTSCGECGESADDCYCGESADVILPPVAGARPGDVVRSLRAVGVEYEADGGSVSSAVADVRHVLQGHHGEHCGHEFVAQPARGAALESSVRDMTRGLRGAGFTYYEDCGLHFHVDMTDEDNGARARAVAALRIVEPYLYALTDGRETVSWCKQSAGTYAHSVADMLADGYVMPAPYILQNDRYSGINTHALSEHGTVEIRVMDGAAQGDTPRLLCAIALATAVVDLATGTTADALRGYISDPYALVVDALGSPLGEEIVATFLAQDEARVERAARAAARESALRAARAEHDADMAALRDARIAYIDETRRRAAGYDTWRAAQDRMARAVREFEAARDAWNLAQMREQDARYAVERAAGLVSIDADYYEEADRIAARYRAAQTAAHAM